MDGEIMKVTVFLSRNLHESMKELASRRRVKIGLLYDHALQFYLKQPANYLSKKHESKIRKPTTP